MEIVQPYFDNDTIYVPYTGATTDVNLGTHSITTPLIIGGTSVTDILKLQGTTGNGTLTSPAIQALVGNNGATIAYTVLNNGNVGIGTTSPTAQLSQKSTVALESAPLGVEITDATLWTATAGWTGDYNAGFAHTAGVTTLSRTMTNTIGLLYQISFTVTGRTLGSFTVGLGGEISNRTFNATGTYAPKTLATNGDLIFTPTTDFNGTISNISVKQITGTYGATYNILDNAGTANIEIRSSLASLNNLFIGKGAGRYNTTGYNNTANGINSLLSNTTGYNNTANGLNSILSNTTGYQNTANGYASLYSNTTGYNNTANGYASLFSNTTGSNNTAYGYNAGRTLITGNSNTFFGYGAGFNASQKTDAVNSMALGNGAFTTADNQVVIGNTSVTQTLLNGNVGIGTIAPTFDLDITKNVAAAPIFQIRSTNTAGAPTMYLQNDGTNYWNFVQYGSTVAGNLFETTKANKAMLFSSGSDTMIGTYSNNNLSFGTNNLERVRIQNNGNVGIGTTAPSGKLHIFSETDSVSEGVDDVLRLGSTTTGKQQMYFGVNNAGNYTFIGSVRTLQAYSNLILNPSGGNVGIGTTALDATNPEKLLVGGTTTTSVNQIVGKNSINSYLQLNIKNTSTGTSASSDVVATADNGSETTNYIDMGINGSGYTGGVFGAANDAYLYNLGQNLYIGTGTASKIVGFLAGGTNVASNTIANISSSGLYIGGTTVSTSKLQVNGSFSAGYIAKTANYTLTISDYTVECTTNSFTITLPTAVGITGRIYNIKNTGTGTITLDGDGTETIDGELTQSIIQWENLQVQSNGSNWIIL